MLTHEEEKHLIELLNKTEGTVSYEVFLSLARNFVMVPIETVIVRREAGSIQVLLLKRDEGDHVWGGLLHSPGTVLRSSDTSYSDAFKRIEEKEVKSRFKYKPLFVTSLLHKVKRGTENALVFVGELEHDSKEGQYFDINDLPETLIDTQVAFIKSAVEHYKSI